MQLQFANVLCILIVLHQAKNPEINASDISYPFSATTKVAKVGIRNKRDYSHLMLFSIRLLSM